MPYFMKKGLDASAKKVLAHVKLHSRRKLTRQNFLLPANFCMPKDDSLLFDNMDFYGSIIMGQLLRHNIPHLTLYQTTKF